MGLFPKKTAFIFVLCVLLFFGVFVLGFVESVVIDARLSFEDVVDLVFLLCGVMVFSEMSADAIGDGLIVNDGMATHGEWATIHRQLSYVLILMFLDVSSFLTCIDERLFILCESGWDAMQVYVDCRIVFVYSDAAESCGFSKHDAFVIWWKVP